MHDTSLLCDSIIDSDRGEECDLGERNGVPLDPNGQLSDTGIVLCDRNCRFFGSIH